MNSAPLWTAGAAARATAGEASGDWSATGVSINTRTLEPGDLFIALQGPNHDGHDWVARALDQGAAAVMVHRRPPGLPADAPLLEVADSFAALNALGAAGRARGQARVVAVTGSVGKTSVKEALTVALGGGGVVHATAGNLNNHFGVPLTLARLPLAANWAVIELGMNRPGEIGPLSRLARPEVAIITTVAPAHLEYFDSIHAIAEAKAEIYEGLSGGTAILNRDNPFYPTLAVAALRAGVRHVIPFGAHPEARARAIDVISGPGCSRVNARIVDRDIAYRIGVPGSHWVMNSLAVLAAVRALGADIAKAAATFSDMQPPAGRGLGHDIVFPGGRFRLVDDSYNASPASMRAAIQALSVASDSGRRIAVLGDMLELGERSPLLHAGLAEVILGAGLDRVYTSGPQMEHLNEALPAEIRGPHCEDSLEAATLVASEIRDGDVVMVKGSLGSRMSVVVETLLGLEDALPPAVNGD